MAFVWELSFNCIIMPSSFISFTVYTLAKLLYQLSLNQSVNINKFSENSTDGFSFPNDRTIWMSFHFGLILTTFQRYHREQEKNFSKSIKLLLKKIPAVDKWTETLNGLNHLWWVSPLIFPQMYLHRNVWHLSSKCQAQLQLCLDWIDLIFSSLSASHPK